MKGGGGGAGLNGFAKRERGKAVENPQCILYIYTVTESQPVSLKTFLSGR